MERRLSIGSASEPRRESMRESLRATQREQEQDGRQWGSAVNFPDNPRFRPRLAWKMVETTKEMEDRKDLLVNTALLILEEGCVGAQSPREVAEIIAHRFGIRRHLFQVYRSHPQPFIAFFSDTFDRDRVYIAERVVDGPIELSFHAWDVEKFGDRVNIPFLVKLSIEGLPQHAWFMEVASKVLCDEALIHYVEEDTRLRVNQRVYECWALCQDPSRIPQTVFLTLAKHEPDPRKNAQVYFVRPRGMKPGFVFKVLIHIDAVEDLMFYHYPRDELLADGRVPWRDFTWELGRADGDLLDDDILPPPTRHCGEDRSTYWHPRDEDEDRDRDHHPRSRPRSILRKVSGCLEGRNRNKGHHTGRDQRSGWFRGESSRGKSRNQLNVHAQRDADGDNEATIWDISCTDLARQHEVVNNWVTTDAVYIVPADHIEEPVYTERYKQPSEAIVITPTASFDLHMGEVSMPEEQVTDNGQHYQKENEADLMLDKDGPQQESGCLEREEACTQEQDDIPITPHADEGATNYTVSPERMTLEAQAEGQELQELLRIFKQSTAQPILGAILQTPTHKTSTIGMDTLAHKPDEQIEKNEKVLMNRQSPKLKEKSNKNKPVLQMAQELVAKKCGAIKENQKVDNMTLQQYINLYRHPLSKGSVQAILRLTEVAAKKKVNQRKKTEAKKKTDKKKAQDQDKIKEDKRSKKPHSTMRTKAPAVQEMEEVA